VWDTKIAEALSTLFLAYNVRKRVRHCWNWGVMTFTYQDMGRLFHKWMFRLFRNGWMYSRDSFRADLCLHCCVTDRIQLSKKWVFQQLIPEVCTSILSFEAVCMNYPAIIIMFSIKWTNKYEENFVILQAIRII